MKKILLALLIAVSANAKTFELGDCVLKVDEPIWETDQIRKLTDYDPYNTIFKGKHWRRDVYWNYSLELLKINFRKVECPQ